MELEELDEDDMVFSDAPPPSSKKEKQVQPALTRF
jgi:hypothetical protein